MSEDLDKQEDAQEDEKNVEERGFLAKTSLFFLEIIKLAVLAGITIALVRYFLFKPFVVKGQSMEGTFYEKDYLIIDEISYRLHGPRRGDVIVFKAPVSGDHYLKRIIGLPGERVKVEDSKVVIYNDEYPQGVVLEESYLTEDTPGKDSITLGAGQFYVMGDNRDASYDSRRFGAIDQDSIVGRVWVRGWPFSRITSFDSLEFNF